MKVYEITSNVADKQLSKFPITDEYRYAAAFGGMIAIMNAMLIDLKFEFPEAFEKVVKGLEIY